MTEKTRQNRQLAPRYSAVERDLASRPQPPSLSDGLKSAIADSLNLVLTPDDEYVWQPPTTLPARVVDEARRAAAQLEHALRPAGEDLKARWLAQLAQLCAGTSSAEDGLTRLRAIARDLDHPPLCFTDDTRIAAARKFKFFPSFAELSGLLDAVRHPYRDRLDRLRRLGPAQAPAQGESEAEAIARRQAMAAKLSELGAMLRGQKPWPDGRVTAPPQTAAPRAQPLHVEAAPEELMARVGGYALGERIG